MHIENIPTSWAECEYQDLLDYIQPTNFIVTSTNYNDSYETPVLTAGKSFIKGYTNEQDGVFENLPVIIFDDFTTATQYVSFKFKVKSSAMKILVSASESVNIKYLYYRMQVEHVRSDTHKRYWISVYAKKNLRVPPENEQHRIVAKIEELFSELDKGNESLKSAREQLKVYRQALLKHAFEGKLTEQWRKENAGKLETADQLLERIKIEREARYQQQLEEWQAAVQQWEADEREEKKPTKPKALTSFRMVSREEIASFGNLPSSWVWTRLENLIEYVTSGSRGWAKYYSSSGATFIRAQNLKNDRLDLSDIAYVSLPDNVEGKRTLIKQLDLLITITGANVTKSAYVKDNIGESYVSQHVALSRLVNTGYAKYLYLFLISSTAGRRQLETAAYGAGKPGLNLGNIKDLFVPIPSVSECNAVTQLLDEKLSIVDEQIQGIALSLLKSESLRQSILKKAFSGQLVPQDPNDEPASVLLERIATEKAELAAQAMATKAAAKKAKSRLKSKQVRSSA